MANVKQISSGVLFHTLKKIAASFKFLFPNNVENIETIEHVHPVRKEKVHQRC